MSYLISNKCGHKCFSDSTQLSDKTIDGESVCCRCLGIFKEDWCANCLAIDKLLGNAIDSEGKLTFFEGKERSASNYYDNIFEAIGWARTQFKKHAK